VDLLIPLNQFIVKLLLT